jgi:hypothetical protein
LGSVRSSGWSGSAISHRFTKANAGERRAASTTPGARPLARAAAATSGSSGSSSSSRCAATSSPAGRLAISAMREASYSTTPWKRMRPGQAAKHAGASPDSIRG